MVVKEEQERVKTLISDTVTLLCRNGLSYKSKFCISALIGITLDEDEVMLVDIRETVKSVVAEDSAAEDSADGCYQTGKSPTSRKRKKHKRRNRVDNNGENYETDSGASDIAGSGEEDNNAVEPPNKRLVKEEGDGEDSDDLVFIKDEPAESSNTQMTSFGGALYQQQHSQQPQQSSDILSSLAQQGQLYATPAVSDNLSGPSQWDPSTSVVPFSQSQAASTASAASQLNMSSGSVGDGSSQAFHHPGLMSKPYQCVLCGASYTNKGNLQRHEKQHRGVSPYNCQHCSRGYTSKSNLGKHMMAQHGEVLGPEPATPAPAECTGLQRLETFQAAQHGEASERASTEDADRADRGGLKSTERFQAADRPAGGGRGLQRVTGNSNGDREEQQEVDGD